MWVDSPPCFSTVAATVVRVLLTLLRIGYRTEADFFKNEMLQHHVILAETPISLE